MDNKKLIEFIESNPGLSRFNFGRSYVGHQKTVMAANHGLAWSKTYVYMDRNVYSEMNNIRNSYLQYMNLSSLNLNEDIIKELNKKLPFFLGAKISDVARLSFDVFIKFNSYNYLELYMTKKNNQCIPSPLIAWDLALKWKDDGKLPLYEKFFHTFFEQSQNVHRLAPWLPVMLDLGVWNENHERAIQDDLMKQSVDIQQKYFAHQTLRNLTAGQKSYLTLSKEGVSSSDLWAIYFNQLSPYSKNYEKRITGLITSVIIEKRIAKNAPQLNAHRKMNIRGINSYNQLTHWFLGLKEEYRVLIEDTHDKCSILENGLGSDSYSWYLFAYKTHVQNAEIELHF